LSYEIAHHSSHACLCANILDRLKQNIDTIGMFKRNVKANSTHIYPVHKYQRYGPYPLSSNRDLCVCIMLGCLAMVSFVLSTISVPMIYTLLPNYGASITRDSGAA